MTTNVYDAIAKIMTSDSRWSYEEGNWIAYVDDTGYDKIVFDSQLGMLFAGNLIKIGIWKDWFSSGRITEAPLDQLDGISIIAVDIRTGGIPFYSDYLLWSNNENTVDAVYGGTGGTYAKDCWTVNKCAKMAVSTAIEKDSFSGGTTLFVSLSKMQSNVSNSATIFNVAEQMKIKGILMDKNSDLKLLVKDVANDTTDTTAHELAKKIINGKVHLSAPFPGMAQPWTNEKKEELKNVLQQYAPA